MTRSVLKFPLMMSGVAALLMWATVGNNALAQDKAGKPAMTGKQMTMAFKGAKVNAGTVTHEHKDGKHVLTWSDDFTLPDTPAPHWQVVDSKGNVYLLQRLKIKDDKLNRTIIVPDYVKDIAKVQIWCAWAEAPLGEASFEQPVK